MKSQTEEQKTSETKKPRFKIEKLEERIAQGSFRNPGHHGGGGRGNGGNGGSPGNNCGHGACK